MQISMFPAKLGTMLPPGPAVCLQCIDDFARSLILSVSDRKNCLKGSTQGVNHVILVSPGGVLLPVGGKTHGRTFTCVHHLDRTRHCRPAQYSFGPGPLQSQADGILGWSCSRPVLSFRPHPFFCPCNGAWRHGLSSHLNQGFLEKLELPVLTWCYKDHKNWEGLVVRRIWKTWENRYCSVKTVGSISLEKHFLKGLCS